jgi:hypothetical protein
MRLRFSSLPGTNVHVYADRPFSTNSAFPTIYVKGAASNALRYFANSADRILGPSLPINTWYHITVARSGTSTKMFVDGSQAGSTYSDTTNYSGDVNRPVIGASMTGSDGVNAWVDEIRVSKGIARWTANFTPPPSPYG